MNPPECAWSRKWEAAMKHIFRIIAAIACINVALPTHYVLAESKAETYLGAPEMCLDTPRIKETMIVDDETILFKMQGGGVFINRLPSQCPGLKIADGFSHSTSISKICKQDIISVLWPDSVSSGKCGLGDFLPFQYEGKSKDAIKLLKEGLMDELVAEGAFKEAFPGNKTAE